MARDCRVVPGESRSRCRVRCLKTVNQDGSSPSPVQSRWVCVVSDLPSVLSVTSAHLEPRLAKSLEGVPVLAGLG